MVISNRLQIQVPIAIEMRSIMHQINTLRSAAARKIKLLTMNALINTSKYLGQIL